MASRLNLHAELIAVLASIDVNPQNVYFQPPESIRLKYPCIIYKQSSGRTRFADNNPYTFEELYEVMIIDRDPDTKIPRAVAMHFQQSRNVRNFVHDNLHHYVFNIYWFHDREEKIDDNQFDEQQ